MVFVIEGTQRLNLFQLVKWAVLPHVVLAQSWVFASNILPSLAPVNSHPSTEPHSP